MTEITDAGITDAELTDMHAVIEKATPGPWHPADFTDECGCIPRAEDRAFIVAARTGWPRALAELERQRVQVNPRITREWEREKDRADKTEALLPGDTREALELWKQARDRADEAEALGRAQRAEVEALKEELANLRTARDEARNAALHEARQVVIARQQIDAEDAPIREACGWWCQHGRTCHGAEAQAAHNRTLADLAKLAGPDLALDQHDPREQR